MADVVHCPDCGAEYRAGYTICTDCGGLLQPGPATGQPAGHGTPTDGEAGPPVTFAHRDPPDDTPAAVDLFEREEHPPRRLILAVMVEEDAPDLVAALEAEGVGARLGERTDDGGVEVQIHDMNIAAAQAVLVDYTGDPSLVDAVVEADEPEEPDTGDDEADPFVEVASGVLTGMATQLARLRDAGIQVRVETAGSADDPMRATGAMMVPRDELERARSILGIEL